MKLFDKEAQQEVLINEMAEVLQEAKMQIEYLHKKFQETGTGNSVCARINSVLNKRAERGL